MFCFDALCGGSDEEVDLSRRELVEVPADIGDPSILVVSFNHLSRFDAHALGRSGTLRVLDLSGNDLTSLPDLSPLRGLRALKLNENALADLPPSIGALVDLGALWAIGNDLRRLPESIGSLGRLSVLVLSFNAASTDGRAFF